MQGTQVWSLVLEDPTCRGATKPVGHNYWACVLWGPRAATTEAHEPRASAPQEKPLQWEGRAAEGRIAPLSPQLEKARAQQLRSSTAKRKRKRELARKKKKKTIYLIKD